MVTWGHHFQKPSVPHNYTHKKEIKVLAPPRYLCPSKISIHTYIYVALKFYGSFYFALTKRLNFFCILRSYYYYFFSFKCQSIGQYMLIQTHRLIGSKFSEFLFERSLSKHFNPIIKMVWEQSSAAAAVLSKARQTFYLKEEFIKLVSIDSNEIKTC